MTSDSPPPKRRRLNALTKKVVGKSSVPSSSAAANQVQPLPSATPGSPSRAKKPKKGAAWTGLEAALRGLRVSSGSFPPLQSAVSALTSCLDVFEQASSHRDEFETLAVELESVANFLKQHLSVPKSSRIISVISLVSKAIDKEVKLISEIRDGSPSRRIIRASVDEEVLARAYRRVTELFSRIQIEIGMETWSIANEHLANTRLEGLNPAKQARYDSTLGAEIDRRQCTEHTRETTLADLYHWSDDPDAKRIYLMNGMAGTGKTTIAYSLAKLLEDDGRLGASFFCTRTSDACRDANRIIPTIAYQLARYSTVFQSALCMALDADPDLGSRNPTTQFERLLREPLSQVKDKTPKHVVIVIDALDECSNLKTAGLIFDLLIRFSGELPVKFFIASRPESRAQAKASQANEVVQVLHLHEIEYSLVQHDIELYLQEELACIEPSRPQITQLAKLAGNLFIFAATAVRYIRPEGVVVHSTERLLTILNNKVKPDSKRLTDIDGLYSTVLSLALENDHLETEEIARIHVILRTVVCLQEPATAETLAVLADMEDASHVLATLEPLRSVLCVSGRTGLVCTLHASFVDFIFHRERSGRFFCDKAKQHDLMAQKCFNLMEKQLRFNICNLRSSYVFDQAVPDLEERIESNISPPLLYTCQHWANHLCLTSVSLELCDVLYTFLTTRLLFWMEVLNLTQSQVVGLHALLDAQRWIAGSDAFYDLRIFIHDVIIFATRYFTAPVSLSTPHIYISALPASTGRHPIRNIDLTVNPNKGSGVISVALSPDGRYVVAGSNDGTIKLWNIGPFTSLATSIVGRAKSVLTVCFSPNGGHIAAGTCDGSVWVSQYCDGKLTGPSKPFEGHKENTWAVNFSADGKQIASGSGDGSIRIWDVAEGRLIAGPCQGHSGAVRSVRFSPDGSKVASSSDDRTVCVWDAITGRLALGPLEEHTDIVWSVDFSPDSKSLVSGSNDGTICIWDSVSGHLVIGPLELQEPKIGIISVKFSSDGKHVFCGSQDNTFCVWDVIQKLLITDPFQTPGYGSCSIALSPDGVYILSAQHSRIIQVGDQFNSRDKSESVAMSGSWWLPCPNPRAARVGFSANGDSIISASKSGNTTCVWDSKSGELVKGPLKGRLDTSWSVMFPGGNTRISARLNNRAVHIWDENSGTIIAGPFQEDVSHVFHLRVSFDGQRTISTNSTTLALCALEVTSRNFDHTHPLSPETHTPMIQSQNISTWPDATGESSLPKRNALSAHSLGMWSVALSPNGAHVALAGIGTHDYDIYVWDANLNYSIAGPFIGHGGSVRSIGFSSDGANIISGSDDRSVRIWDATLGIALGGALEGHGDSVLSAVFSPDGKYIASGSKDCTVRIWDIANWSFVTCRKHIDCVWVVDFSPSGTRVVSSSVDQTIIVWDPTDGSIVAGPFNHIDRNIVLPANGHIACKSIPSNSARRKRRHGNLAPGSSTSCGGGGMIQPYQRLRRGPMPRSDSWLLRPDGWWATQDAELLFWVPPEHRSSFGELCDKKIRLGDRIHLGDEWDRCH